MLETKFSSIHPIYGSMLESTDSLTCMGFGKQKHTRHYTDVESTIQEEITHIWASLVAQLVKNPPAMQETWVQSLGWEDPLEKGTDTHSSILAWRIPWTV